MKIRSYNSSNKYGLAVKNVKELLDKGCKLLKVRGVAFVGTGTRAGVICFLNTNKQKLQKETVHLHELQL